MLPFSRGFLFWRLFCIARIRRIELEPTADHLDGLIDAAFSQRRKTLRNAAGSVAGAEAFARAGIDPGRRGETLSVGEFIALCNAAG